MQEGDSIQDHINKIKLYQDKLEAMGGNLQEEDILAVLLASLPESYETLMLTLEAQPKITVKHVISCLLQEETRRKQGLPGSSKNEGEAYFMQKQNSNNKKNPREREISISINPRIHAMHVERLDIGLTNVEVRKENPRRTTRMAKLMKLKY